MPTTIDQMIDLMVKDGQSEENILVAKKEKENQDGVPGCMDMAATNYNPNATTDDGSCIYSKEVIKKGTKPTLPKLEPVTIEEVDPHEAFLIKPEFFGPSEEAKSTINEEEAMDYLVKKLDGLGIDVDEHAPGKDVIEVDGELVSLEEEGKYRSLIKKIISPSAIPGITNKDRADIINDIILEQVRLLSDPTSEEYDEKFIYDTYVEGYQNALNDTPDVYLAAKDGGRFLKTDELSAKQLHEHRSRVHLNLMKDYFESDEGKEKLENIDKQKAIKFDEIYLDIASTMRVIPLFDDNGIIIGFDQDPTWAANAQKQLEKRYKDAVNEIWNNDKDVASMQYTTSKVVASMFDKDILEKEVREKIVGRYGNFIGKSDILSSFATGATVTFPKEIQEFTALQNSRDLQLIQEQIDKLDSWEPGKKIGNIAFFELGEFEYTDELDGKKKKVDLNFSALGSELTTQEEVNALKQKAIEAYTFKSMEVIGNLIKAREWQEKLNGLTFADSELYKDGKFNVTADNWQRAVGDQAFRMMSSIFTFGMTTMVAEGGGMFAQALDGFARDEHGDDWDNPKIWDKKSKAEYLLKIIEQEPEILAKAIATGGTNTILENISNVFFVGKVAKPITDNIGGMWTLFMKGKMKQAIQKMTGNASVKDIALTTLIETLTEGAQEVVTQYNIGSVLDSHVWSWDSVKNAMITAALTTPVIHLGATTTKSFASQISRKIQLLKNKENILALCKRQQNALNEALDNDEITQKKYDEETLIMTAVWNGASEIDKEYNYTETVEALFEAQVEIEKGHQILANLKKLKEKAKDKYGEAYDETINQSENQDEFKAAVKQIQEAELLKRQVKRIDQHKTKGVKLAAEINADPNIKYKARTFKTTSEAVEFLIKTVGIPENQIDALFVSGEANAFIMSTEDLKKNFGIDFNGNGIAVVSDQNVVDNIMKGDVFAQNAVTHEFDHMLLDSKSDAEIGDAFNTAYNEISNSTDPQMKQIKFLLDERIKEYEKKLGKKYMDSREGLEEKFIAIGEVCAALEIGIGMDTEVLTVEGREVFVEIGKKFKQLLHPDETVSWGPFDALNFLASNPKKSDRGTAYQLLTETVLDDNNNPVINVRYSLTHGQESNQEFGGTMDLKLVREAANLMYKPNRNKTEAGKAEILRENEKLEEKIKEAENFVSKDPELQKRVRDGAKVWRERLMFNNWGHFEDILKKYDPMNKAHSTLNQEMWNSENLLSFVKAVMVTWQPKMLDKETGELKQVPFAAYYFGNKKVDGKPVPNTSIAFLRQADIWEKLDKKFTEDIEEFSGQDIAGYSGENVIDLSDQVEEHNERSELVHSIPGFEFDEETQTGNEAYEKWLSNVQTTMVKEYDNVFDENFRSKIRKKGRNFWKQLKNSFDGKVYKNYLSTKLYNDWITNTIEDIYNQMPQKVMNENYTEFTEVVTERMTAEESKYRKDLKTDDIYSGTGLRRKLEFTDEVREAFLEKL